MARKKRDTQNIAEVKPYKLYLGKVNAKIPKGVQYSFIPSTLKYLLLYTNEDIHSDSFIEIDERVTQIPQEVRQWLFLTKAKINYEYLKSKREEVGEIEKEFFTAFEEELKKEQKRASRGKNGENDDGEKPNDN